MKCAVCNEKQAEWSWQPWGPDEDHKQAFMLPGSHYRGFSVVKVCDCCKERIQNGEAVEVKYRGKAYPVGE
jgi:hypothetical protein